MCDVLVDLRMSQVATGATGRVPASLTAAAYMRVIACLAPLPITSPPSLHLNAPYNPHGEEAHASECHFCGPAEPWEADALHCLAKSKERCAASPMMVLFEDKTKEKKE